ncbi:phage tail protein [Xenorhabdus sp. SF857]|uniref:phage tail protein n=1 Tax=Xenorhabdus bakwenae TaxID=3026967 RepID=UPI002557F603|nr:phage tail protein [Xenorhabdus sp. SF857]WFQ80098.1 phage tail protein [Xenorhabdus sp. SF857]
MADDNLKSPVEIQATRIDATLLPSNFSQPYFLYVVQQGTDLGNVANKANQAGDGAYDAQVKNDEQDKILANHETRIEKAELTLVNHEERITKAEDDLKALEVRVLNVEHDVDGLKIKIQDIQGQVSEIKVDYVSKSTTSSQTLSSPINVKNSYLVNDVKVIGPRVTGFTAMSGSPYKDDINVDQSWTAEETYTPATIQSLMNQVTLLARRLKAIDDANRSHGLTD